MYYIFRHGENGRIVDTEYKSRITAEIALNDYFTYYQRLLERRVIKSFTCMIITKGVRNEKTKGSKH